MHDGDGVQDEEPWEYDIILKISGGNHRAHRLAMWGRRGENCSSASMVGGFWSQESEMAKAYCVCSRCCEIAY